MDGRVLLRATKEGLSQTLLLTPQSAQEMAERMRAEGWDVTFGSQKAGSPLSAAAEPDPAV